ncbi:dual specificity protein phosphatase 3-like [Hetaerina americana]|uniref:dual specificity protein phosphatase 3-like n=1 Tax=Hetaerina americana TaxID=62018 RepID=UPI003A7F32EB
MPQKRSNPHFCTTQDLSNLIIGPSGGMYVLPHEPWNEVYPGILIGDKHTALCTHTLKDIGITHVLNAAQGNDSNYYKGFVNTNSTYYNSVGIAYKGFPAADLLSFDLSQYFAEAANFIEIALQNKGKVLVHCYQGISRSATLVIAYLMLKCGMTAQEAIKTVRSKREIIPNNSFLRQLCDLNQRLAAQRTY